MTEDIEDFAQRTRHILDLLEIDEMFNSLRRTERPLTETEVKRPNVLRFCNVPDYGDENMKAIILGMLQVCDIQIDEDEIDHFRCFVPNPVIQPTAPLNYCDVMVIFKDQRKRDEALSKKDYMKRISYIEVKENLCPARSA